MFHQVPEGSRVGTQRIVTGRFVGCPVTEEVRCHHPVLPGQLADLRAPRLVRTEQTVYQHHRRPGTDVDESQYVTVQDYGLELVRRHCALHLVVRPARHSAACCARA